MKDFRNKIYTSGDDVEAAEAREKRCFSMEAKCTWIEVKLMSMGSMEG